MVPAHPILEQPTTSPGEPQKLPSLSVHVQLRTPLLRPDAVRLLQSRMGWSDEALVAVLSGSAFAEPATGRIITAEGTDIWEHPSSAPGDGEFLCGPQRIGAWLGAGPLTIGSIVVPAAPLRATAVPPDEADEDEP